MVGVALQQALDALSLEDRVSLLEYLERTTDFGDAPTAHQLLTLGRRDSEMDADPSIGLSEADFMAKLRAT